MFVIRFITDVIQRKIELVKEQIKQYKEIREVVHKGEMYRLRSPFQGRNASWEFVYENTVSLMYYTILARSMLGKAFRS